MKYSYVLKSRSTDAKVKHQMKAENVVDFDEALARLGNEDAHAARHASGESD